MILGFDTSGPYVGVAVWDGEHIRSECHDEMAKGQAEALMPAIEACLTKAGSTLQDVEAIGVGIGPGNFTGIRISVAAARGLARALSISAFGVSGLEAVAYGRPHPVMACVPAPKDQIYLQGFGTHHTEDPKLVSLSDVPTGVDVVGACFEPASFAPAAAIARIVADGRGLSPPVPLYLRQADAAPSRIKAPRILP